MQIKEKTRREIEERLQHLGNYVQIDYLLSCLKQQLDFDTKKFVLLKLSKLYEDKKMYLESGKMIQAAAPINTTFLSMMSDYMKAAELFVRAGNFDNADIAFEKATANANEKQRQEIKNKKIDLYKIQADYYLEIDKRHSALLAYEKLLSLNLGESERGEVQSKLLDLYSKLGKIREYYALKRAM